MKRIPFTRRHWQRLGKAAVVALVAASHLLTQPLAFAVDMSQAKASFLKMGGNPQAFADWQKLLKDVKDLPINDKLKRVNEFFNRHIHYATDWEVWNQEDYWATPMESLSKGRGDCEDYVIAKYYVLRESGVPDRQLRLIYVRAHFGGADSAAQEAHMVLAYYAAPDSEPLVLDSQINDIRPASRRPDLTPVFSFNAEGVYSGVAGDAQAGPGGVGRLSRWADLLQRARAEGFTE
ncbi:MAG TPA: transglutaminase-like cysteine peptidase [Burkholderiaceae bacterium]